MTALFITPQQLAELANTVAERFPNAMLYKSRHGTGNLVIHLPVRGTEYDYVGIIDLAFGELHVFGDEDEDEGA
jgi:hypothetical protein